MDAGREAQLIEFAKNRKLFLSADRGMPLTLRDGGFELHVPQGGATAGEVNELIDAGKLVHNLAGRAKSMSGFYYKPVTVA